MERCKRWNLTWKKAWKNQPEHPDEKTVQTLEVPRSSQAVAGSRTGGCWSTLYQEEHPESSGCMAALPFFSRFF